MNSHGSVGVMLLAPEINSLSDVLRGRPLDTWPVAPQRRDGSMELPPDYCEHGHDAGFVQGWDPLKGGRTYYCKRCGSVQVRY